MGQKVHPTGIRLGISKPWTSTWYANTADYADNLYNDHQVRQYLTKQLKNASLSKIVIERPAKSIRVTIHTARPGVVIGKKGEDVEKLRNYVSKLAGVPAQINIAEGEKQAAILSAEGNRQSEILRAEGEQQAAVLRANGFSEALERINGVASTADGRTMSLQYFETLKSLGESPSTKWIFPMEFTSMLGNFLGMGGGGNGDGNSK